MARLADALNAPETKAEAGEIIRSLIERIVLTSEGERLRAELYGDLASILAFCEGAKRERGLEKTAVRGPEPLPPLSRGLE